MFIISLILTLSFWINSYSQDKPRTLYIKTISTKVKPNSNALLAFQGCDHAVFENTWVAYPDFKGYSFYCDSLKFASNLQFDVSTSNPLKPISFVVTQGDLKYVDGDSIIVNLDKQDAKIINKNRPNRRN